MARRGYPTDLTDAQWAVLEPLLPAAQTRGGPRRTDLRAVVEAILYLLRSGGQWRLIPSDFPPWGTVGWYFRRWRQEGAWARVHRALHRAARVAKGQTPEPAVVIMDSQSVKTTEKGGVRGFDGHTRVKGRKRQILVDANGFLVSCRVEPAGMSDRRAVRVLTAGLAPLWPRIRTVIADAGYESAALTQHLVEQANWELRIIKRPRPGFEIVGPNWIVERTFAWLGRHRRLSKDYKVRVQSSEALIPIAACSLRLKRLAPS